MGDGKDCLPGMRAMEAGMPGNSTLTADAAERAALRDLSKSEQRGEADRARAILLTLGGRHAGELAALLEVYDSTVGYWQGHFAQRMLRIVQRRPRPGRQAVIGPHAAI